MRRVRDAIVRALQLQPTRGELLAPRPYGPGDPARTIDWRATARSGRIMAREYAHIRELRWCAVVDDSPSMHAGAPRPPFDAALSAAAAWRECACASDAWLGVYATGKSSLQQALHRLLPVLPARCALLWVSDFYDLEGSREALGAFAKRFVCAALVVSDPWPDGLPRGGALRAADSENGRVLRLRAGAVERARYIHAAAAREAAVADYLRGCGWRAAGLRGDAKPALALAFALT